MLGYEQGAQLKHLVQVVRKVVKPLGCWNHGNLLSYDVYNMLLLRLIG